MLENTFLESLTIIENNGIGIGVEELFALVSALQLNNAEDSRLSILLLCEHPFYG
jgi:hypothetical protein